MLGSVVFTSLLGLSTASVLPQWLFQSSIEEVCDCHGDYVHKNKTAYPTYVCGDPRLGPKYLPKRLPLGTFTSSYDRFGGMTPDEFVKEWWDPKAWDGNGGWKYPPNNGFQLDENGKAIKANMVLLPGTFIDRFGADTGRFVSPASAPFAQRALPPDNLNTPLNSDEFPNNYHVYLIVKNITVEAGPILPWFGQSGLHTQFFLGQDTRLNNYLKSGHVKEVDPRTLIKEGPGCGFDREDL